MRGQKDMTQLPKPAKAVCMWELCQLQNHTKEEILPKNIQHQSKYMVNNSQASLTVRFTVKSGDPPGAGKIWENRFCPKKKWTNRIKKTAKSRRTHAKEPWELVRLCFRSLFWTNESPCDLSYAIIQLKLSVLSSLTGRPAWTRSWWSTISFVQEGRGGYAGQMWMWRGGRRIRCVE